MSTLSNFDLTASSLIKLTRTANLVRRRRFKCLLINHLLTRHNLLQRRDRIHNTMATHRRRRLPALATRPLQRRRIPTLPDRRTLQRKPLHRLPSPPLPNPLPPLRTQPPRPPPNRLAQPHPLHHPSHPRRTPPPPPTTRLHRPPPQRRQQTPHRRDHPRTKPHPRPGPLPQRPGQTLPAA